MQPNAAPRHRHPRKITGRRYRQGSTWPSRRRATSQCRLPLCSTLPTWPHQMNSKIPSTTSRARCYGTTDSCSPNSQRTSLLVHNVSGPISPSHQTAGQCGPSRTELITTRATNPQRRFPPRAYNARGLDHHFSSACLSGRNDPTVRRVGGHKE